VRIVKLTAENIKRLQAVEVTPQGDLVVIGGKNDAGKSSLLDAIEMALGGEGATPAAPVRRGQQKARVVVDLGDIVVTREFSQGGSRKLVVANKDGARYPSPQAMLDALYSRLTFDPLAFERQDAKAQAETLRGLVGLDVSDLDERRRALYEERTLANREVKALQVKADSSTQYLDAPPAEIPIAVLAQEMAAAEELKREALKARHVFENEKNVLASLARSAKATEEQIEKLEKEIAEAREDLAGYVQEMASQGGVIQDAEAAANAADAKVPDVEAIRKRMAEAEGLNEQVRTNRQHALAVADLEAARKASADLTSRIEGLDAERIARLAAVRFPVEGLGIDDDGVTLGGLPFEQASTSDRIRVSVAIGLAMNPKLRVLLVRDGSLLGEEKLGILAEMAKAADAQVWLEMLQEGPDARTSVYIEDGSVRGVPAAQYSPDKSVEAPANVKTKLGIEGGREAVQEELL
jgi:DNA repair exonuclease SbcCD ATPase subunit